MQTEIEAKFLDVDHNEVRRKLQELGATCAQPMRLMRRKNFDYPDARLYEQRGWVRVRDEGGRATLAYKQLDHRGVDGTKEVSLGVEDFETACQFLESIGLVQKSYQETKRESWLLDGAEVELDEWPWIKPFLEIEAASEDQLFAIASQLGFSRSAALHGSVEVAYQQEYDVTEEEIDAWKEILITDVPKWLEEKRR